MVWLGWDPGIRGPEKKLIFKITGVLFRKDYGDFQGIVVFGKAGGIVFAEDKRAFVAIGAFVRGKSEGGRKRHKFARHPFSLCGGNALRDDKLVPVDENY